MQELAKADKYIRGALLQELAKADKYIRGALLKELAKGDKGTLFILSLVILINCILINQNKCNMLRWNVIGTCRHADFCSRYIGQIFMLTWKPVGKMYTRSRI